MQGGKIHIQSKCISLRTNAAPSIMKTSGINLLIRLITPGHGAICGTQFWSLLLADWALSNVSSQASLGECNSMLLSLCITSILSP